MSLITPLSAITCICHALCPLLLHCLTLDTVWHCALSDTKIKTHCALSDTMNCFQANIIWHCALHTLPAAAVSDTEIKTHCALSDNRHCASQQPTVYCLTLWTVRAESVWQYMTLCSVHCTLCQPLHCLTLKPKDPEWNCSALSDTVHCALCKLLCSSLQLAVWLQW